jgi:hypothetical protein
VKRHAPKKPVRKPGQSEADFEKDMKQYEQDRADYMTFVGFVGIFLSGLAKLFRDIFVKIKEFFRNLWNWIRAAVKNITQKVAAFLAYLKDKIARGIQTLFGSSV